jgi:HK97 family phage major capsid protein
MPNRLLERLGSDYSQMVEQYESILNRCADEQRDPNEAEQGLIDGLRSNMEPLGERIMQLRAIDDQRMQTVTALTAPPDLAALPPVVPGQTQTLDSEGHPIVHVRSEAEVYRKPDASAGERFSFFRDLYSSQQSGDVEARSRLDRHDLQMRAAATSATGTGTIPPTWLFSEFAIIAHGARPVADTVRRIGITDANPVTIGVQAPPGAAVTAQASENTAPNDGSFNANQLVTVPKTLTGKVDVSRQLLDGSNPAVDGLVFTDCMGSYNEQVENTLWAQMAAMTGANLGYNGTFDASVAGAQIPDAVIIAATNVRTKRKAPPSVVFCSENMWGNMMLEKDTQGRPIIVAGYAGPMNARGVGEAVTYGHIAGQVAGLPVVPSWAGADIMYVSKADDVILLESSTFNFRYEEVLGPESIRLGVWGYAAVVTDRYPLGWGKVTITPPLSGLPYEALNEIESEPTPNVVVGPDTESNKGNGGTRGSSSK